VLSLNKLMNRNDHLIPTSCINLDHTNRTLRKENHNFPIEFDYENT
jgi:hypothetical protein